MRTKTLFKGLKNSQRIRLHVNDFGFITTVDDAMKNIVNETHRDAVESCFLEISKLINGDSKSITVHSVRKNDIDVKVDFIAD